MVKKEQKVYEKKIWYNIHVEENTITKTFKIMYTEKTKTKNITVFVCKSCKIQLKRISYFDSTDTVFKTDFSEVHKCLRELNIVKVSEIEDEVLELLKTQKFTPSDIFDVLTKRGVKINIKQIYYLKNKHKEILVKILLTLV